MPTPQDLSKGFIIHEQTSCKAKFCCTRTSTRNDMLTHAEHMNKAGVLSREKLALSKNIYHLTSKLNALIEQDVMSLPTHQEEQLLATIESSESAFQKLVAQGSPAHLLWEQQKESAKKEKECVGIQQFYDFAFPYSVNHHLPTIFY